MVYDIKFEPKILLENIDGSDIIKDILDALKDPKEYRGPERMMIKGGLARLGLLLTQRKRVPANIIKQAVMNEQKIRDIDIVLPYYGNLSENIENLVDREDTFRQNLNDVLNLESISFDVEPLRIKSDVLIFSTFFGTRDLTINQTYMFVGENSEWHIVYSKRCWRDLVMENIGLINPFGPKMARIDHGIRLPVNRGFYRLMRALVHKKVEAIWLPKWQIKMHLAEMKRIGQKPLGNYPSLIAKQYENENPDIQNRWIQILRKLGFTELNTFETLLNQANQNKEFIFKNEKIPFREQLNNTIKEMYERQSTRQAKTKIKNSCNHEWKNYVCDACGNECHMRRCIKQGCVAYDIPFGIKKPDDLLCNRIFLSGNWREHPEHLIYL